MEAYSGFAQVYDFLMDDVDYDKWIDYIEQIFKKEKVSPKTILELACGTGNVTNSLAKRGYSITGIDISSDMLTMAQNKAEEKGVKVKYINQDIREFLVNKKFDSVICVCDGLNYILKEEELLSVFKNVYNTLSDDGLFVFDISSYYKISHLLGNNTYAESYEDVSYIWQNYFDKDNDLCELDLTIFVKENDLFQRINEIHIQRAYKENEIVSILEKSKFNIIGIYQNFSFDKAQENSERINFICKK